MRYINFFTLVFGALLCNAQSGILTGNILDEKNKAVAGLLFNWSF
jgi:hypothetical protein